VDTHGRIPIVPPTADGRMCFSASMIFVAQIASLPYRRMASCRTAPSPGGRNTAKALPICKRRNSRLPICVTLNTYGRSPSAACRPAGRTTKSQRFCAWPCAANRDGSRSAGGSAKILPVRTHAPNHRRSTGQTTPSSLFMTLNFPCELR